MPLIVEDGLGIAEANSYVTIEEADGFWADRNVLDWAGAGASAVMKEGYLIEAADYLNQFYSWKGEPYSVTQSMGLPTLAFDGIPWPVKVAQFYLARDRAANGPLSTPRGERLVASERKSLTGVGEKEVTYVQEGVNAAGRIGAAVDAMLSAFTVRPGTGIQTARVDYGTVR